MSLRKSCSEKAVSRRLHLTDGKRDSTILSNIVGARLMVGQRTLNPYVEVRTPSPPASTPRGFCGIPGLRAGTSPRAKAIEPVHGSILTEKVVFSINSGMASATPLFIFLNRLYRIPGERQPVTLCFLSPHSPAGQVLLLPTGRHLPAGPRLHTLSSPLQGLPAN